MLRSTPLPASSRPLFLRWRVLLLTVFIGVGAALFLPTGQPAAQAACSLTSPLECLPGGDRVASSLDCKESPPASGPSSGLAGWFLRQPKNPSAKDPFKDPAGVSTYDAYGYAGLSYTTYDLGCGPGAVRDPSALTTNTIANLLYSPAMWLVALDNSVREYAYQPNSMWGWTDQLVARASSALADRVFNVWGVLVLGVVGVWLLWGARGGNMSAAVTTAGWALLVMALVSAVAAWPLNASRAADSTLTGALGSVSGAMSSSVGGADGRPPAVRASGVMTQTVLYQQWLRGTLGSSDSDVAKKYGPNLYRAHAISWYESKKMQEKPDTRSAIFAEKAKLWETTAAKVKAEDPEAYEYLVGRKGTERVGAAMLALISAVVVTPFDLMASILVLVAFLIIRLAVAFLPAIGTIGILRPASGPLRSMLRTVVAAIINCVIFGVGSAVFLLAVEVITGTSSLAGWQQILLMWLTGVILWLLLRPYRRLTQLTGVDPMSTLTGGVGRMHQRVFGELRRLSVTGVTAGIGAVGGNASAESQPRLAASSSDALRSRPETWSRGFTLAAAVAAGGPLAVASAASGMRRDEDMDRTAGVALPAQRRPSDDRLPDRYRRQGAGDATPSLVSYPRIAIGAAGESHPIYQPGRPENASRASLPLIGGLPIGKAEIGGLPIGKAEIGGLPIGGAAAASRELVEARPEAASRPSGQRVSSTKRSGEQ
ncbi:MAG: hypothetical protein DLM55_06295 [Acidimicrobiales bacterium]|nr:MAG: hypothetical protein DLM55_06295 [Acidimicrobiales bacterium]